MAHAVADRVKETTTTTGTGTLSLAGAVTGFRTFVAGIGTGNTCWYCIEDSTDWEVGVGTVTDSSPDTLSRTTVFASSNAGAKVNWGAGSKEVFGTLPATLFNGQALKADFGGCGGNMSGQTGFIRLSSGVFFQAHGIATQSVMEAAALSNVVTADVFKYHPGVAKFWVNFSPVGGTGSATVNASYNTTSVSDDGTGDFTVTIGTDFSTANWSPQATAVTGGQNHIASCGTIAAGTIDITCFDVNANQVDPSVVSVQGFGDQ